MSIDLKRFFVPFSLALLASFPALAQDTLHLRNGDKLSGEIIFYDPGQVHIKTKYGLFQIPVTDIGGVASPDERAQQAIAQRIAGTSPVANQGTAGDVLTPQALTDGAVQTVASAKPSEDKAKKKAKAKEEPKEEEKLYLGAKWSGNANFGAGLRTGNSETSNVNADATVKARWEKHRASVYTEYNREEDDGDVTVDNQSIQFSHDYFFAEKWFLANNAEFTTDDIDRLDLRMILSSGLGYQPYEQDDLNLKFILSPGYIDEEFEDGSGDSSLTYNWMTDYNQKFFDDLFRVFHRHDLNVPADDNEAFLFESSSGIRVPIRLGIIASGQIDFDWDNDPAEGTTEDDTTYSLKLGYEW